MVTSGIDGRERRRILGIGRPRSRLRAVSLEALCVSVAVARPAGVDNARR